MDYKKIWSKANTELKSSIPEHAHKAWIETLVPIGLTNNVFIVEAPIGLLMIGLITTIMTF